MTDDGNYPLADAWDRLGTYGQSMAMLSERLAQRNLALWKNVSSTLRQKKVSSDALADNLGSLMLTLESNLQDIWSVTTQPPVGPGRDAGVLPTAFLHFRRAAKNPYLVPAPVFIPTPSGRDGLDDPALIVLDAGSALPAHAVAAQPGHETSPPDLDMGVRALSSCLATEPHKTRSGYLLSVTGIPGKTKTDEQSSKVEDELQPGYYQGLIYLDSPALALANLRVVVEA